MFSTLSRYGSFIRLFICLRVFLISPLPSQARPIARQALRSTELGRAASGKVSGTSNIISLKKNIHNRDSAHIFFHQQKPRKPAKEKPPPVPATREAIWAKQPGTERHLDSHRSLKMPLIQTHLLPSTPVLGCHRICLAHLLTHQNNQCKAAMLPSHPGF